MRPAHQAGVHSTPMPVWLTASFRFSSHLSFPSWWLSLKSISDIVPSVCLYIVDYVCIQIWKSKLCCIVGMNARSQIEVSKESNCSWERNTWCWDNMVRDGWGKRHLVQVVLIWSQWPLCNVTSASQQMHVVLFSLLQTLGLSSPALSQEISCSSLAHRLPLSASAMEFLDIRCCQGLFIYMFHEAVSMLLPIYKAG